MIKKHLQIYQFLPIYKQRIWGSESWKISSIPENLSIVANGSDEGLTITEAIEKHKEILVGRRCYKKFGSKFPLLLKFIEAQADLSIQVHPSGSSEEKTEMWYVVSATPEAEIITGLTPNCNKEQFINHIKKGTIISALKHHKIAIGDLFYIPSGRVHAIKKGCLIAEIQQASDTTFRLYDYDRTEKNGEKRELHIDQAISSIDFNDTSDSKIDYIPKENQAVELVNCPYFTTSIISITQPIIMDYSRLDSFIVYMCVDGDCEILDSSSNKITIKKGETILLPACSIGVKLSCQGSAKLLQIHL